MAIYLLGSSVLLNSGSIATSQDCCCVHGVCCNYGGDCGTGPFCDDSTTQSDCEAQGGTWFPDATCADSPCDCTDQNGNPWVTHITLNLSITGSATLSCSPYSCSANWNCSYFSEADFDPCNPTGPFVGGSDPCITCPEHCRVSDTCSPDCLVSLQVVPSSSGLVFSTPFAFLVCHCEVDVGYATTLGPSYRPHFEQSWCGWPHAAGTYNLSDTVSWDVACPSLIGTGSATWNLEITIS